MKKTTFFLFLVVFTTYCSQVKEEHPTNEVYVKASDAVQAGRYLIKTAGCNDCHTEGFMENPEIPESEWLTGSVIGWQGPWGTTYPKNLRLTVHNMTEEEWVTMLKTRKGMPPMPWPSVNNLSEQDARAMYAYIKWLGLKGEMAPTLLAPGVQPLTPYLSLVPQNMPVAVKAE